jgi:hypothetical protein
MKKFKALTPKQRRYQAETMKRGSPNVPRNPNVHVTNQNAVRELINGIWVHTGFIRGNPESPNFVIVCRYGDWSGFRTLAECEAQNPDADGSKGYGFYWIEER